MFNMNFYDFFNKKYKKNLIKLNFICGFTKFEPIENVPQCNPNSFYSLEAKHSNLYAYIACD